MAAANQDPVSLFIASIEQIKEVFVRYIPLVGDPAERQWMEETLGVLNHQQANFEATVPMSIAQTQKEFRQVLGEIAAKQEETRAVLAELDKMPARFDQQLDSVQASLDDMAKIPIPPPSVPQLDEPEPPEPKVELLSGSDLRELLCPTPRPEPSFPKISGNIWENWDMSTFGKARLTDEADRLVQYPDSKKWPSN